MRQEHPAFLAALAEVAALRALLSTAGMVITVAAAAAVVAILVLQKVEILSMAAAAAVGKAQAWAAQVPMAVTAATMPLLALHLAAEVAVMLSVPVANAASMF